MMGYHGRYSRTPIVTAAVVHHQAFVYVSGIMRARNIKPGFFKNDELAELEPLARLLFQGLWCLADREGRLEDRPKRIKAEVLPYDDCDVYSLLNRLWSAGFIIRYKVGPDLYIQVVNFDKHQNPHVNEKDSEIPPPNQHSTSTVQVPEKHSTNPADPLLLIPDTGFLIPDSPIAPKKSAQVAKPDTTQLRPREPDLIFETVAECWIGKPYQDITLTKSQRGVLNASVNQLKQIKIEPSEIPREWAILRERYDNPSPTALVKHWGTNGTGPRKQQPSTVGEFNRNESDELWDEFYAELEADSGGTHEHGNHLRNPTERRGPKGLAEGH